MKRRKFIKMAAMGNALILTNPASLIASAKKGADSKFEKIKIGQIGVSHAHAPGKIRTLKRLPDLFEIVGIVDDRNTAAANYVIDKTDVYDDLKWMTEEELFSTPGLQAVTVETSNAELVNTALRCMKHNLAMHMDKPGGDDLALFGELLQGCRERNLPFQMGYMFRNNPAFQFSLKAVQKGWLGDVLEVRADMSHDYGGAAYDQYLGSYKGGMVYVLICHHIDFIVSMLGRPQHVSSLLKSTPGTVNEAENNCLVVLEYPNTIVSLSAFGLEHKSGKKRYLEIYGSKGTIRLSPLERFNKPMELELTLFEGNEEYSAGTHTVDLGIMQDRYEDQFRELAKIIRGEMENPYTFEHDYLTQEVIMAASGYIKWE